MLSKIPNKRNNFQEYSGNLDGEATTFDVCNYIVCFMHFENVKVVRFFEKIKINLLKSMT